MLVPKRGLGKRGGESNGEGGGGGGGVLDEDGPIVEIQCRWKGGWILQIIIPQLRCSVRAIIPQFPIFNLSTA